jgi:hypothetical protein
MTTLISWIGVDSRQPASIYLASDSRISWNPRATWDVGKKLYACKELPELFGYCGDVTFPNSVLPQICEQIDAGLFFGEARSFESKLDKIADAIGRSRLRYPSEHARQFQILYASRSGEGMNASFHAGTVSCDVRGSVLVRVLGLPPASGLVDGVGSGSSSMTQRNRQWQKSDSGGTSRAVFSAFCDSLDAGDDPLSGGAPQLVGLYRIGGPKAFGIVWKGRRYFYGLEVDSCQKTGVEWRNSLFERYDASDLSLLEGAQRQPRPSNM